MKPRRWLLVVMTCQCGGALALLAQTPPAPGPSPVHDQVARLIHEDATRQYSFLKPVVAPPTPEHSEQTLELPAFIVREKRPPALPPPLKETQLQEFFRTGTLFETRPGIKLWMKGDKGIMLTFPF
jgi:hypothetical protein